MAQTAKIGTYLITPGNSPFTISKSDCQALSFRLSNNASAGTYIGTKTLKGAPSVALPLDFGTPVSISEEFGFDEIEIDITAGSAQLIIL